MPKISQNVRLKFRDDSTTETQFLINMPKKEKKARRVVETVQHEPLEKELLLSEELVEQLGTDDNLVT